MLDPDATEGANEVPPVRTRKQTEKGLANSLEILFDRRKRLLLRLHRKSENIKNLMENKFNFRAVSEEFKQYDDLSKLFSGVQGEYHGKPDDDQQKADDFWFDEVGRISSPLSILYTIICEKMKRSCQEGLEVLEKLNHQAQVLVLSLESLENQLRSKLSMKNETC